MDRDTKFRAAFRQILEDAGTEPVLLPPRSPNLNAHLERFWRSVRSECLDRLIFFGEARHRFVSHYHGERNHQGLGNRLIEAGPEVGCVTGSVASRERLGGMLRYYYRQAAWFALTVYRFRQACGSRSRAVVMSEAIHRERRLDAPPASGRLKLTLHRGRKT
jgi:hypothetical protein